MATVLETPATTAPVLPGPDQRPLADLVIYDGNCRICTAKIRFIERWFASVDSRICHCTIREWPCVIPICPTTL